MLVPATYIRKGICFGFVTAERTYVEGLLLATVGELTHSR
jgi:hypothetical protein